MKDITPEKIQFGLSDYNNSVKITMTIKGKRNYFVIHKSMAVKDVKESMLNFIDWLDKQEE